MKNLLRGWLGGILGGFLAVGACFGLVAANNPGARLAAGALFVGNSSGVATAVVPTGDVTINSSGVTALGSSKVTSAMITDGVVASADIAVNTVVSADVDQNVIQVDNTQLTNAQILALRATPITLIASPGANTSIVVHKVCIVLDAAAGAYTESADDLAIEFAAGTDIVNVDMTDGFDDAAVTSRCYIPYGGTALTTISGANTACSTTCGGLRCLFGDDGAIVTTCADANADSCVCAHYVTPTAATAVQAINTGNGEWGGGNAANTMSIRIWYSHVPTIAFSSGG